MNEQIPGGRGRGFSLAFMLAFMLVIYLVIRSSAGRAQYTYTMGNFTKDLQGGNVISVEIIPNRETPTGSAVVTLKDETERLLYATDITRVEEAAREAGLDPTVRDVPADSSFLTSILPTLLMTGVCIFFFWMIMQQQGGGGANSRMMNFGRSRAKL
ncbi:MAG: cell division protein FtsH, partial [Lachnospiraceae bacterium]|nr:cell division protein FtsH [Lachnospiraceae bacterium]